jgi:hypothetical protein
MSRYGGLDYYYQDCLGEWTPHTTTPMYASRRGDGDAPAVEAYPFQSLSVPMDGYDTNPDTRRSLRCKHSGEYTPSGTLVAQLIRQDLEVRAAENDL